MQYKEVTPGMVIWCEKERDANRLLRYLKKQGYHLYVNYDWYIYRNNTCFRLVPDTSREIVPHSKAWFEGMGCKITKYEDLILNDAPTEMSAADIVSWLREYSGTTTFLDVFGCITFGAIPVSEKPEVIVKKIEEYERKRARINL